MTKVDDLDNAAVLSIRQNMRRDDQSSGAGCRSAWSVTRKVGELPAGRIDPRYQPASRHRIAVSQIGELRVELS